MLIRDKKILFQIFDFTLDRDILRLFRLIDEFKGEGGVIRANIWAGESKKGRFNDYKEWVDKLEAEKFNFTEFKCTAGRKAKKEFGIKSVQGYLKLSPLNELWFPLCDFECKTRKDENIRLTCFGPERVSKWKKKSGINDFPSILEFYIELAEDKQQEDYREIIADMLQRILPLSVNEHTSGYIGFTPGKGLGIHMQAPFKVYEDLKKKVCMPYPIVFGPEEIFSGIKPVSGVEYRPVEIDGRRKYIISLFNGNLSMMYNNYKYLFIDFHDKKYKDDEAEGDIKINGRVVARTKKRINEMTEKGYFAEEELKNFHHVVFEEFDDENGLVFDSEKLYIYFNLKVLEHFKEKHPDYVIQKDASPEEIVEYHMKFYRWYEREDCHKLIEDYLKQFFGVK